MTNKELPEPEFRSWPGIVTVIAFSLFCYFGVNVNLSLTNPSIGLKYNPFASSQQSSIAEAQQSLQKKPKSKLVKVPNKPKSSPKTGSDVAAESKVIKNKKGRILFSPTTLPPCGDIRNCQAARDYARKNINKRWNPTGKTKSQADIQYRCLVWLFNNESNWKSGPYSKNDEVNNSHNKRSSAYGIPQAMEKLHEHPYNDGDYKRQVDWGIKYIVNRYDSPCKALSFWLEKSPDHWY